MLSILLFFGVISCTIWIMLIFAACRSGARADDCMAYWAANRRLQPRPYLPSDDESPVMPTGKTVSSSR